MISSVISEFYCECLGKQRKWSFFASSKSHASTIFCIKTSVSAVISIKSLSSFLCRKLSIHSKLMFVDAIVEITSKCQFLKFSTFVPIIVEPFVKDSFE